MSENPPDPAAAQRGIQCPKCHCRHFRVIYTRALPSGRLARRRECRYCGHRVTTIEKISG